MSATYRGLRVERRGPVGWLIFDRPDVGNAMDAGMLDDLPAAWAELDADPEVRVIVNTGGGSAFQTGLDVRQLARDPGALREQSRRTKRAELRLTAWHNNVGTPVIAAVNGVCAGGGLHFVADADVVLAAESATFLDPHVSVGQASVYELIGLAHRGAVEPVARLGLTGRHERLDAARAHALGFVSQVVPDDTLAGAAQSLAEQIASRPPEVLRAAKRALWSALETPRTTALRAAAPARTPASAATEPRYRSVSERTVMTAPSDTFTYTEFETLRVERRGPVGWLLFNRPDRLNAMTNQMRDELAVAWLELDRDPAVRVIVNTGEGRAFQTGVDVAEIASDGVGMERYRESMENFDVHFTAWHQRVAKPVIAAVNGVCAGGGFHFVADADVVIAATDAQFTDPHVSIGQVVAIEAIGLLRKMPFEPVMRMALTGRHERMSAERAYQLGMVSQLVEPDALRDAAQELGELIARNSPVAMAATKRALWGALETGLTEACRAGAKDLVSVWGHPDQTEGPAAWAEKREAKWAPLGD
ncbi:Enoyl-CoA hydratase/carnithine racemase [Cryptosporangium aurantiacum]|uniref:Enoyl-CoA hydratase/carnithine racemase n=2 Tax=Cryptosporangium aurantiacum TaxID=134849 RepID=A0A1M7RK81_9ACTN|nr:enoyl-CoA hydratase-related protein [Cryptosporangium aurantiacum]SHN46550.1 Enoyl-CoA hydratase/carnithine racemase [Cryptosporangium aurantiacum]